MLITAAQVADTLPGLSPTDALLVQKVREADAWAKLAFGRQFERGVYALKPRVYGAPYVLLQESPIRAVVSAFSDPTGLFQASTQIRDVSKFTFNPLPGDDDNRLDLGGYALPQGVGTFLLNVEAGWWPADDPVHESDIPADLSGALIKRARVEFKRAVGVSDEETKQFTDEVILNSQRRYRR